MSHLAPDPSNSWRFHIAQLHRNAEVLTGGLEHAWLKFEYAEATSDFQISLYANYNDADPVAQSAVTLASTLPDTISLAEYDGSGVTASVSVTGVTG